MSRAVGDPDSIRQLGRKVKQTSDEMDKIARELLAALKATDWNDDVKRRFEHELTQLAGQVKAFRTQADNAERYLQEKAKALEAYLQS